MSADKNSPQLPNYFELFQNILSPFTAKAGEGIVSNAAAAFKASVDPKEITRKKQEMETVLMWLKAQVGVVELSIKTLEYQLSLVEQFSSATAKAKVGADAAKESAASIPSLEELAKLASEMNPAAWAMKMMREATVEKAVAKTAAKAAPEADPKSDPKSARKPNADASANATTKAKASKRKASKR